jgi:hypothetical protein
VPMIVNQGAYKIAPAQLMHLSMQVKETQLTA